MLRSVVYGDMGRRIIDEDIIEKIDIEIIGRIERLWKWKGLKNG